MKKILSIALIFLSVLSINAQDRKKVGVVLSGGGAKGVAHVRALKVIEEAGIPIDYLAGTSMGAIVGALYSIGYTPHQLDSLVMAQDWSFLLSDGARRSTKTFTEKEEDATYVLTLPFNHAPREVIPDGIIKGQNLENVFIGLTTGYHDSISFKKFPIPFACVAVDLRKGEEVVFGSGMLAQSMRASMAIPAFFTPVRVDSMVLVDGGLINNYPVDVARNMGAEIVIGVDVHNDPSENDQIATVADIVNEMTVMLSKDKYKKNLEDVDLHIKVDVEGYNAGSFNLEALDTLLRRGEEAARGEWDNLIRLKEKIGIREDFVPDQRDPYHFLTDTTTVFISSIRFNGVEEPERLRLIDKCKLGEGRKIKVKELREAVDALYATQIYTNISYTLFEEPEGYALVFSMDDNRMNLFRFGLRFDWEEIASVLLNTVYNFNTSIPTTGAVTARFGRRSGVRLDYNIMPNPLRYFTLSYSYLYNDINIYNRGEREYNATYHRHLGDIGYSNIFNQDFKLGLGLRYEYFHFNNFLSNSVDNQRIKSEGVFSYYGLLRYETMDKKTYPTNGTSLQADLSVYTDNLYSYNDNPPFCAAGLWWKSIYSVTDRFAIIPSAYGRVLFGDDSPYAYLNAVGGDIPGRYVPHQIPFEGINYMELMGNSLFVAKLQLRQKFANKHYVSANVNFGLTDNKFKDIFTGRRLAGGSISYGYDSLFGPLEASLNYSNSTREVGFYLNVGYKF